jgi:hypothetical protein
LRIVAKLGLPFSLRALYRLSRLTPAAVLVWAALVPGAADAARPQETREEGCAGERPPYMMLLPPRSVA